MGDVAVYAAVGKQSEQMKRGFRSLLQFFTACKKGFILEEIAVLDFFGDTGQLLVHDAACTHVQMTYLRVSHLALRKTYSHSAGHDLLHTGYSAISLSMTGVFASFYGISFYSIVESVTIENH